MVFRREPIWSRLNRQLAFFLALVAFLCVPGPGKSVEHDSPAMKNRPVRTIVIDPGHGGSDSGVIGPEGTTEKSVTLALARLIASQLQSRYRVLLTRTGDYQVSVDDRIAVANHNRADLYLSLHVGGGFSRQCNPVTIFFLSTEDDSDINPDNYNITDFPVHPPVVNWDEAYYDHQRLGKAFADILGQSCRRAFGKSIQVKSNKIAVLEGADMPSVMIEMGCLANPDWDRQFRDSDRIVAISSVISEAIVGFFQSE